MTKILRIGIAAIVIAALVAPSVASAGQSEPYVYVAQGEPKGTLELVGHDPLWNRGSNSALVVHNDHAYIGSRTDEPKPHMNGTTRGVLVVDVSDPSAPEVVNEIAGDTQSQEGETSREMRVWASQDILIVMNLGSNCSYLIHGCSPRAIQDNFSFYDISGKNAADPKFISKYEPSVNPHEFYLWEDPKNPKRSLLFISTPGGGTQLLVTDISGVRKEKFIELGKEQFGANDSLHSLTVAPDGKLATIAHLTGGFLMADMSAYTSGKAKPKAKLLTKPTDAANWEGPGVHSATPLYGTDYAWTTDEAYGDLLRALGSGGCPWGWARTIDISDPAKPKVVAEYKLPYNEQDFCTTDPPRPSSSYSAHNPTLTEHLAFTTWHAGGLQVVDLSNPAKPSQAAVFVPEPELYAAFEDPALTAGQDKVAAWSFPIIVDGLIYFTDIRNGLYIVKYKGPYEDEVSKVGLLDGNSNQGDALELWNK